MLSQLAALARPYSTVLSEVGHMCMERFSLEESHVQALWQTKLQGFEVQATSNGLPITILEWGILNRGDGPDFKNALIVIDGIVQRGDVEIHLTPRDWDYHQHINDPNYANVILHVTWFDKPNATTLPAMIPQLALEPLFREHDWILDWQTLKLQRVGDPAPCLQLFDTAPEKRTQLLASAGYHRFLMKAQRFYTQAEASTPFQIFYEGLLRAMGYQRNSDAFTRLAQEVPFKQIEHFSTLQRFAILAGLGGLLKPEQRHLWDLWWKSGIKPSTKPYQWDLRALRPQNHPYRRLAGGLGILDQIAFLLEKPLVDLGDALVEASLMLSEALNLKGSPIGLTRAHVLINNLFVPYRLATGTLEAKELLTLPGEATSAPMREVWSRLTGKTTSLPKDALQQQGLLQIYNDFCHNDHVACATCPLCKF